MGEVWKARDPRLNRDVAIKVSAAQFSEHFEREAKAIAALNHPNICQIYDVGPNYIVMEYIEGESPKGPIPLEEALRIARQIADALEAAHDKGITHRDLKPGNIKIKSDGTVKVLDFGLAKVTGGPASSGENSPTLTIGMTQAGMILGTASYMAPEQARGKESVDKRADIWAFGVVLYELLTGRRLFTGEDVGEILASVIKEVPDLSAAPPQVLPLLERCLEKDPKKRLRDIGDMELLLAEPTALPVQTLPMPRHRSWLPWCIAAFLLLALMPANILHFRESPPARTAVRFQIPPPEKASFEPTNLDLSPDGRKLAFTATGADGRVQVWVRSFDSLDAQPLPGTEGAISVFWSPDNRFLGFGSQGKLRKIDVSGGPPQTLCDLPSGILAGGSWSTGGVIIFGIGSTISSVPQAGGVATAITTLGPQERIHVRPHFLPDGKHFIFYVGDVGIYLGTLGSKEKRRLVAATTEAYYAPPVAGSEDGHLLFLRETTLMAQALNARSFDPTGDAFPIAEGVGYMANHGFFSVSSSGALAYLAGGAGVNFQLGWFDRDGKFLGPVGPRANYLDFALSPDATRVAVSQRDQGGGNVSIWLLDLIRGIPTRFTSGAYADRRPIWSPDGSRVAFASVREFSSDIYQKDANGSGTETVLVKSRNNKFPLDWSADGQYLMYWEEAPKTGRDLWVLTTATGAADRKPAPYLQTPFNEDEAKFSPGQGPPSWVAYTSDESGRREVYLQSFPVGSGKVQLSSGGSAPMWRRDGKEIFYTSTNGEVMSVEVQTAPTFRVGIPKVLFAPRTARGVDVTPDGKRFLLIAPAAQLEQGVPTPITVVLNWQAALKH
jgi:serine/threonine protein kinase